MPKVVGGHITVTVDEQEYQKGLEEHRLSLIGRLILMKGNRHMKTKALKASLAKIWGITESTWNHVPLGKGYFNIHLNSAEQKSLVFVKGSVFLKLGVFHISERVLE